MIINDFPQPTDDNIFKIADIISYIIEENNTSVLYLHKEHPNTQLLNSILEKVSFEHPITSIIRDTFEKHFKQNSQENLIEFIKLQKIELIFDAFNNHTRQIKFLTQTYSPQIY